MYTDHLASLGGREVPRDAFLTRLSALTATAPSRDRWSTDHFDLAW
jgi:leucyl/phenylalanyl-tRNA--protein transferase